MQHPGKSPLNEHGRMSLCRGSIPPVSSEVYRQKPLSRRDWGRVMAWANCMEAAFKTQVRFALLSKSRWSEPDLCKLLFTSRLSLILGLFHEPCQQSSYGLMQWLQKPLHIKAVHRKLQEMHHAAWMCIAVQKRLWTFASLQSDLAVCC